MHSRSIIFTLLSLTFGWSCMGQKPYLLSGPERLFVGEQRQVIVEDDERISFDEVRAEQRFWEEGTEVSTSVMMGTSPFWVRTSFVNTSDSAREWIYTIPSANLDFTDVYLELRSEAGQIIGVDTLEFSHHAVSIGFENVLIYVFKPEITYTLYYRVDNHKRPTRYEPYVSGIEEYQDYVQMTASYQWVSRGFYLLLALIAIIFFIRTRQVVFLWYTCTTASLFFFVEIDSGYWPWGWPEDPGTLPHVTQSLLSATYAISAYQMISVWILKNRPSTLARNTVFGICAAIVLGCIPAYNHTNPNWVVTLFGSLAPAGVLVTYIILGWLIMKEWRTNRTARHMMIVVLVSWVPTAVMLIFPYLGLSNTPDNWQLFIRAGLTVELMGILFVLGGKYFELFKEKERLIEADRQNKQKMIQSIIRTQEDERDRIGRDLHDGLVPQVAGITHGIKADSMDKDRTLKELQTTLLELRRISHNLVAPDFNLSDIRANIEELRQKFSTKRLRIQTSYSGELEMDDPELALDVYRIVQEMMMNAMKHSTGSEVFIHILMEKQMLSIFYEDDGEHFEFSPYAEGIGVRSIHNRVERHGGEIRYSAVDPEGNSIIFDFPIREKKELVQDDE